MRLTVNLHLNNVNELKPLEAIAKLKPRQFRASSLQFRLTVGITAVALLGLGAVVAWTSWKMQQILVVTHVESVKAQGDRFPRDVALYSEMLPVEVGVQRAIDNATPASLLIWAKRDGEMIAQSQALAVSDQLATDLMSLTEMPIEPRVYRIQQRYFVLSNVLLPMGENVGQVFIAQDITEDQITLQTMIRSISLATLLALIGIPTAIGFYIRRSLQPLRQMSELAGTISVDDLAQARLYLDAAPSEVRELAQTFDEMLERLSQAWEQQRQFVSNASHELRTPLTVVYGYLQSLMRRSSSFNEAQKEVLEIAIAETDRTIRLLQDLLDLARADSGAMHYRLEPVELGELVREIVGMGEPFSHHPIKVSAPAAPIWIKTDRDRLRQVLINLVDNAVNYSDATAPIEVALTQTETQTLIQVSDRGCGIPLQHQARIFDRFYRVDEARARSTGGVGLGLSIVKSLVEGLGGQVSVCSKPSIGSTFTVALPMSAGDLRLRGTEKLNAIDPTV